ncbi:uncharacterized protein LOC128826926 [Malaclemys terrapin pileata]|uniref:uncharacterized protein LOC128826926 n=1 Tax=Malaclemys terrapin pileata TaxID=2991368 RepID=UPI0023A86C34|nr:uncharacterized protein LOC128826926 [Malaclemys terrapin pileata]
MKIIRDLSTAPHWGIGASPDGGYSVSAPLWPTQDIVGSHPPNHVLEALEHLALENTLQMQELTSRIDIPRDVEALKFRYESARLETWRGRQQPCLRSGASYRKAGAGVRSCGCNSSPYRPGSSAARPSWPPSCRRCTGCWRTARSVPSSPGQCWSWSCGLCGWRGCRELEREASARHAELQDLQSKRQRILDFRHLVVPAGPGPRALHP